MAINSKKEKLIEDAQKLALRGQFDKAARIYEQLLTAEPAAFNLRQKLAELYIKCGRSDDARKELETIGKNFSKNGFYLKAIAVYKQLQKLFPGDISITMTLAELNEKHGLVANSLSEYKLVYEFHEKSGNVAEALNILDRMQNVDPLNVPIKIKLAEAYAQKGKNSEAYGLFAKTASLLLDRGDRATLAKITSRVLQLFPNRPDFMLEVLTEQLRQGNAASAIDTIQSLLRSDPLSKRAWDLVVQAYQLLNQPQRVKIAFQHYLKFLPAEPDAMIGLIQSVTAERDLTGALELLDRYESGLIARGFLQQLEQIYRALDKLDPINIRILEGHIRVATASGNDSEVLTLTSKLQSLQSVSRAAKTGASGAKSPPSFVEEQPPAAPEASDSSFFDDPPLELETFSEAMAPEVELPAATAAAAIPFEEAPGTFRQPEEDEEFEIDIDIDIDSPFGSEEQETETAPSPDNWLDSVGDLFDSINTAPRGVKFGNEMESSDAQSHYDLGLAFKEMGLYDEAINEFRQASQDPARLIDCLVMQCTCLRERGELEKAVTMLKALLKPGLSADKYCAISYELASAYEASGKNEEANLLLKEISVRDPGFRDISSRLSAVTLPDSLDFSDEELKDF